MKEKNSRTWKLGAKALGAAMALQLTLQASTIVNFPFDEGSGARVTDTASGLVGSLGFPQNAETDTPQISNNSPSGAAGDNSLYTRGNGFLVATNLTGLAFPTNQAFTVEAWVNLDPNFGRPNEGIVTFGNAYKLGLRSGEIVFTLFGVIDIPSGIIYPAGEWHHVAAVWEPGKGVTFYYDGWPVFVDNTANVVPGYLNQTLVIGAERFNNNVAANIDRVRIHAGALTGEQIDSVAASPKPVTANTRVAFNFNENQLPARDAVNSNVTTLTSVEYLPLVTGPLWTEDDPTGRTGNHALVFDGTRRVVVPDPNMVISPELTDYTLEAWVKMPDVLPSARMILFQYEGQPGFSFSVNNNGTLHTTTFGKRDITTSVVVPRDQKWHHVAVVHQDGVEMRFYLDGVLAQRVPYDLGVGSRANPTLTIGMASNGANAFTGSLDRVRISRGALTVDQLDYPAIPGLPVFTAQPSSGTVFAGSTVTLTAAATGAQPLTTYWQFRPFGSTTATRMTGQNNSSLTLTNVSGAQQGYYSLVVSNNAGVATSLEAKLTVAVEPTALEPVWALAPGDRVYLTSGTGSGQTDNLERGMAYNPVTDHLLIVARETSPVLRGVYIVDAKTGAHVGQLDTTGISGGTFVLNKIGVAEDGVIYAGNFGSYSPTGTQFTVYRWENEGAVPTVAFRGNPGPGFANAQWGKNFAVRGSGTNTQILLDTRGTLVSVLTTSNGVDFVANPLQSNAPADAFGIGLDFGIGNTFWGKNLNGSLFQMAFNLAAGTATVIQEYRDVPALLSGIAVDVGSQLLAGINIDPENPDATMLFDLAQASPSPALLDLETFPTDNLNRNYAGNVAFGKNNLLFALDTNNGLVAYRINRQTAAPELTITKTANGNIQITWAASATGFVLESSTSVGPNASWSPVTHESVDGQNRYTTSATGEARFFRLRK